MNTARIPETTSLTDRLPVFPPGEIRDAAHRRGQDVGPRFHQAAERAGANPGDGRLGGQKSIQAREQI
jgi:hypothetical protein